LSVCKEQNFKLVIYIYKNRKFTMCFKSLLRAFQWIQYTWIMYHIGTIRISITSRDPPRIQFDSVVEVIGEWIIGGGCVDGEGMIIGPI